MYISFFLGFTLVVSITFCQFRHAFTVQFYLVVTVLLSNCILWLSVRELRPFDAYHLSPLLCRTINPVQKRLLLHSGLESRIFRTCFLRVRQDKTYSLLNLLRKMQCFRIQNTQKWLQTAPKNQNIVYYQRKGGSFGIGFRRGKAGPTD